VSDWGDLRYFLAVFRARTLAAAGKQLRVEATTVGRRVTALERDLEARLFDRTPQGFVLTEAGERVLDHAIEMEAQVAAVERKVSGDKGKLAGGVRLATSENLSVGFLASRLQPFLDAHPTVLLDVETGTQAVDLLRREADLALRVGPRVRPEQQSLIARKLASVGLGLYASSGYLARRGHPSTKDGCAGHRVIGYCGELAEVGPSRWLRDHAHAATVALRANSMIGAARAVASGAGLGLLPCFVGDIEPGLERAIAEPVLTNDLWLVVHPELRDVARVRVLYDFLVELVRRESATLSGTRPRAAKRGMEKSHVS
jgi:DNA-binding transcriptional LysR family regulator